MTPAIDAAKKAKVEHRIHQYQHDPAADSYGLEAAEALDLPPEQVFKTLVAQLDDGKLVVAIVPVARQLDLKALAAACKVKKAAMAPVAAAERSSGYVAGGISPLGQRKRLTTLLDESALSQGTIFVSAGRRGLEIELKPADLLQLTGGRTAPLGK